MLLDENENDYASRLLWLGLDQAASALILLDNRERCLYLNEPAERLTGFSLDELQGRGLHEMVHHTRADGEPYPLNECPIHLALVHNCRDQGVELFLHKNGSHYPVAFTATPVREDGKARGLLLEIQERTPERAVAERPIDEVESRYRILLESIDKGFFICEIILDETGKPVDYRFLEMNASFEKLTGIRDATGKTARELIPDLEPHWFDIYGSVALTGKPVRFSEGSDVMGRWFDVHAFPVGEEGSMKVGALFTNVSDRKRAEEEREALVTELELERSRLATVFQEAPAAIATLRGRDHVFEMANPLYYRLSGKRDIIGKAAREVFPEVVDQGFIELLDKVYSSGEPFAGRGIRLMLASETESKQSELYLDFVYQPLRDADGSVSGIFVHVVDVTEHKRTAEALGKAHDEMEERVEARTAELKALNEELESFNYSVSHDLRAPLRGIDGFSQVLLEEYGEALDTAGRRYLKRILTATSRMGELIDDLLDLARLTRASLERQELDLSAMVRELAANLSEREPGRDLEITVEEGMTAFADASLMRIAMQNLLENAVKFTRKRQDARIEIGMIEGQEDVVFVRDNGTGFDMEYAVKLFEPFQRLHGADEYPGTGIGLATVQRIVHKHGGRIWATAEPDKGATFSFTMAPHGAERTGARSPDSGTPD